LTYTGGDKRVVMMKILGLMVKVEARRDAGQAQG